MKKNKYTRTSERIQYIESIREKLEKAMPEVHRQVRIYEERLKAGTLKALPKHSPLFSGH